MCFVRSSRSSGPRLVKFSFGVEEAPDESLTPLFISYELEAFPIMSE